MVPSHIDWVPPESFDEYRLIKALGRGSMGQVWLAHDTVLDRPVAVKFIAAFSADDAVRQRFLTEARAAARVQHPNIIAVYRVGEIGSRPYLISEYVRGNSLDKIARPVAWPRLLEIAIGLARGLAAAHDHGVLHRDLKPANAIVSETGEVKLLNFGLAKLLPHVAPPPGDPPSDRDAATLPSGPDEPRTSRESFVLLPNGNNRAAEVATGGSITLPEGPSPGFPRARESEDPTTAIDPWPSATRFGETMGAYMPPEAWRSEPATPRSDVYSLGALLYSLGAGTLPHRGGSREAVREAAITTDAPSLAIAAHGIHPGFAAIVDRCLRRDPTERFASGHGVQEALEAIAAGDATTVNVRPRPLRRRALPHLRWAVVIGAAFAFALFAYHRFGGELSPPPVRAGHCPKAMVPVPAGTFLMGSPAGQGEDDEHPQHAVTLSAYCIDTTEVTVAAYAACVADRGCRAAPLTTNWYILSAKEVKRYSQLCNQIDYPDHPINCIDWDRASAYCTWQRKRLPTEAEWEYAARGNDGRIYPWGNEPPNAKWLNMCGSKCVELATRETIPVATVPAGNSGWETTPVGSYPEGNSVFGALDMAGNVAEWTADWYGSYAAQAETNPHGPSMGTSRVTRGRGGWDASNTYRAADRGWPDPRNRGIDLGFRCARGN